MAHGKLKAEFLKLNTVLTKGISSLTDSSLGHTTCDPHAGLCSLENRARLSQLDSDVFTALEANQAYSTASHITQMLNSVQFTKMPSVKDGLLYHMPKIHKRK